MSNIFRFVLGYYRGAVTGYYVYYTYKLKRKLYSGGLGLGVLNV